MENARTARKEPGAAPAQTSGQRGRGGARDGSRRRRTRTIRRHEREPDGGDGERLLEVEAVIRRVR